MSNHNIEINFDTLKYNLYDILGVKSDASKKKIKKAFLVYINLWIHCLYWCKNSFFMSIFPS